jgi:cyclic pyranopterin monophosphate synthase
MSSGELSHLRPDGTARMVDVGEKPEGERMARARAAVRMSEATARAVEEGNGPKGDVVGPARIAGIAAAKRTGELIPLAHPLALTFADVEIEVVPAHGLVRIEAEARVVGRTGVEMEAMTACAVAALTIYDTVKGIDRGVSVESIELIEKRGGRSGHWRREQAGP